MGVLGGWAFSYERGTPVGSEHLLQVMEVPVRNLSGQTFDLIFSTLVFILFLLEIKDAHRLRFLQ